MLITVKAKLFKNKKLFYKEQHEKVQAGIFHSPKGKNRNLIVKTVFGKSVCTSLETREVLFKLITDSNFIRSVKMDE